MAKIVNARPGQGVLFATLVVALSIQASGAGTSQSLVGRELHLIKGISAFPDADNAGVLLFCRAEANGHWHPVDSQDFGRARKAGPFVVHNQAGSVGFFDPGPEAAGPYTGYARVLPGHIRPATPKSRYTVFAASGGATFKDALAPNALLSQAGVSAVRRAATIARARIAKDSSPGSTIEYAPLLAFTRLGVGMHPIVVATVSVAERASQTLYSGSVIAWVLPDGKTSPLLATASAFGPDDRIGILAYGDTIFLPGRATGDLILTDSSPRKSGIRIFRLTGGMLKEQCRAESPLRNYAPPWLRSVPTPPGSL